MPDDATVFKDASSFVVRFSDVMQSGDMRGQGLQFACCGSSVNKVCKASIAAESEALATLHRDVTRALNNHADTWGKQRCNAVEVLLLAECQDAAGAITHHIALMARAWFNPKWQLWCLCEVEGEHSAAQVPFVAKLANEFSKVCPEVSIPKVRTTEQFALVIARSALNGHWSLAELQYTLPTDAPHLLSMVVNGRQALATASSGRRAPANIALKEFRSMLADAGGQRAEPTSFPQRGRGGRGKRPSRRQAESDAQAGASQPRPPPLAEMAVGSAIDGPTSAMWAPDQMEVDTLEGLDADDLAEALECLDGDLCADDDGPDGDLPNAQGTAPMVATEAGLSDADAAVAIAEAASALTGLEGVDDGAIERTSPPTSSADGAPVAAQEAAPASESDAASNIVGPGEMGYFRDQLTNKSVARITGVYGTSVSVKCYLHAQCSVSMAEWKLPSVRELRTWVAQAELILPTDSPAERQRKCKAHKNAMRELAKAATWPGRSRQALIDEARAQQ